MQKPYHRQLSTGANNTVVALSEMEVAKIFSGDKRSESNTEAEKLKFANSINGLLVKFLRIDFDPINNCDLLVMERIYPIDYRSYEIEKRKLWANVFEVVLKQLHKRGFVHNHLQRSNNLPGDAFDNILLTPTGLRLIDAGNAGLQKSVGDALFNKMVKEELRAMEIFKSFFLSR